MIIDSHGSITPKSAREKRESLDPTVDSGFMKRIRRKATVQGWLGRMDRLGIDKACVWWTGETQPKRVASANDWIKRCVDQHPSRFIGFANVYPPRLRIALGELKRSIERLELSGLKIHPFVQGFKLDDPKVIAVLKKAREYDIAIVTHTASPWIYRDLGDRWAYDREILIHEDLECPRMLQQLADANDPYSNSTRLAHLLRHFDYEKTIAAHFGGIFNDEIRESNVIFQTAGASIRGIEWAHQNVGDERIIFGSDFPFMEIEDELEKVNKANLPEAAKGKILGSNFARLLG